MANKNSQEQSVDAQDTIGSAQESTKPEHKALDEAPGTMTGSGKDVSHNMQAALDRLQLLESEHRELTLMVHQCFNKLAEDNSKGPGPKIGTAQSASLPKCEIARISNAEWRARQKDQTGEMRYSLLTVAPKERGDSGLRSQAVEVQPAPLPGSGQPAIEASAVRELGSKDTDKIPYRAILNGSAELMEVLGRIFDTQFTLGLYFWIWPFKYLIDHAEELRARLSEEELKFGDSSQNSESGASPSMADEAEDVAQNDDSGPRAGQASGISLVHADPVEDLESEQIDQERMPSQEDGQAERNAAEFAHMTRDHDIKADSFTAGGERKEIKAEQSPQTMKPDTQVVDDTRLRDELRCLVTFMDTDLRDIFSVQKDIDNGTRKLIAFDHLWQLYKPGHVVVSGKNTKHAYVVLHVTGGRTLQRDSQHAVAKDDVTDYYDRFQRKEREAYLAKYSKTSPFRFMLAEYEGEVAITSLEVFPIRFDEDPKKTEKSLVRRGRKFVKLARGDHKYYSGRTLMETKVLEVPGEVHGEIIVDFTTAINHFQEITRGNWDFKFGTGVIANPTLPDKRQNQGYHEMLNAHYLPTNVLDEDEYDNRLRVGFVEKTSLLKERNYQEKLPDEALVLLPPRVYGFSLIDRKWFAFDISLVEDIKDSNQGFDHLVIPEDHKKITQALVRHHTKRPRIAAAEMKETDQGFSMDLVRGKGKGLIILLHGVPGVGKTSTAECVAAQTGRPLFPITCGDIGSIADQVEARLYNYFDMAHKWGCVLLLDEADVFLARREKGGDLQRNGIVSVFLRVLEYYSGILILTTNRIGEFDEAFSSRVHIKLYYPKLDRKSTLEIWKMNIRRIAESEELGVDINEDEIKRFARRQWADSADNPTQRWNGRQIRNAFQSAIALAKWDHEESKKDAHIRPCLSVKQFEIVAQTSAHFDAYITTMHGIDEGDTWETIAARDFLRKNETPRRPTSRLVPTPARTRAARRSSTKTETFEDDDDGDETDTDENEEQMKKLEDRLKKMKQKKQGLPDRTLRDPRTGSSKTPEIKVGDSSGSSEEDRD